VGLAAAAIAAIGASLVNTKEFGDVALRNYWNAVDAGRGIGQTDPVELAQGFINFYRTNKNEFAGQQAYGRTGNEQFLYDMTQVINDAVKSGKVDKNIDAGAMYRQVVQPWLNSLGSGPQNEDAKRIQDFMMTDLINSFMQGKPISNAQVKGDTKYDIVSKNPVYGGDAPTPPPLSIPRTESIDEIVRQAESFAPPNPFAAREDRVSPIREMREAERESIMPVAATTPIMEEPVYGGRESIMPPPDFSGIDAGLIPEAPPPDPMRGVSLGDAREGIMPVDTTVPITEEPPPAPPILPEPVNPYAEQEARRVEQERFAREQEAFRQAEVDRQEMARQAAYQRQMEYEAQQRFEAQRQAEMQRQYEMQQAAARAEAERQAQIQRQYEMQQAAARAEAIRQAEIEAARRAEEDRARFYIPREEAVPIEPYYAAVQPESVPIEPYYAAVQPESVPIEQYYAPVEAYNPYAEERFSYRPEFGEYAFAAGGAIGEDYNFGFARGGTPEYLAGGKLLKGPGDGMSDSIPAVIRGKGVQRAALADGEFVIPADVVSHLGNGSTNAGAKKLYAMMNKIRQARTGRTRQAPAVKTDRYLPA
jgi:hypothetical protein